MFQARNGVASGDEKEGVQRSHLCRSYSAVGLRAPVYEDRRTQANAYSTEKEEDFTSSANQLGDKHDIAGVVGKSKDTFDIEGSPLAKAIYKHQWEHQVFSGRPVPKHIREGDVQFKGFLWRDGMPKHITSVEGVDENGVKFHWDHRRQRKGRTPYHEISKLTGKEKFYFWDWVKFWKYHHTPQQAVSWYPAVFGACFFFWPGVWLMVIENANTDLEMRRHNWRVHGEKGRKPGFRWLLPVKVNNLLWWASLLMFTGATAFNVSTIASCLLGDVPEDWTTSQEQWWIYFTLTYGSAAFIGASIPFCWDGTHSFWRGYFPFTAREWKSLPFWVNAWQLWGSIGFLISSAVPYKTDITWKGQILQVIFGNLIGSVWFGLNGYFLTVYSGRPGRAAAMASSDMNGSEALTAV
ncbi:MAG: hypothetical protein FRX49_04721 [Trebouxia sp. A1-2]|nr:MAG: hypothetical protein FRX49_04721 [Trebouxia sp. A1-2]